MVRFTKFQCLEINVMYKISFVGGLNNVGRVHLFQLTLATTKNSQTVQGIIMQILTQPKC